MADLPIELWHLIFDHLQLVDLFSCAQVSKAVYLAVKAYRIREIAFTGRVYQWFHYTTPTIDHKYRLDYPLASILRRSSFNFDCLKRLKIGRFSSIDLNEINKFTRLEELDIDLKNYKNKKSRTVSLANLKVIYVFMSEHLPYLELDTPSLAKVCTFSLEMLEFVYPESVRCIHTFFHSGKLSTFRNLEYLTLTDSYNLLDYSPSYASQNFKEFSLIVLKKLKEIHFYYNVSDYRKNNLSNFKEITANFLALGLPSLKMFWLDVQVTDMSVLAEYELIENARSRVAFQLQHYEMLKEKDHFFWWYDFNGSMKKLSIAGFNPRSEEFTSRFLSRYSFRLIMVTGRVEERELLLELIARSPDLFYLEFENSGLDQSFFDRMVVTVRLKGIPLGVLEVNDTANESMNFHFLLGLPDLMFLQVSQRLPKELVSTLLQMPQMHYLAFCSGEYRIERLSSSRFHLNEEPLSLQELLLKLFEMKSDSTAPEGAVPEESPEPSVGPKMKSEVKSKMKSKLKSNATACELM